MKYNKSMDKTKADTRSSKTTKPGKGVSQLTPGIEEGPYYKAGSPEKTRLFEAGMHGDRLTLTGCIMDTNGKPIPHAWLDFWHANAQGEYDNAGYTLRGHQYADKSGKYTLETIVPGGYSRRTPHIHVKVRASERSPVLTVQLFMPGVASNKTDFLYREDLEVDMKDQPGGKEATFDFVVSK
jgi:protocatechuate 3,4-dioxygenase beta subunit